MKTALMRRPVRTLIHDSFLLDRANPLASPLKAEPGPGFATVTDTGSKLSISGGQLRSTSVTVSGSDPKLQWPDQGSRPGLAIIFRPFCSTGAGTQIKMGVANLWINMASGVPKLNNGVFNFVIGLRLANVGYAFVIDALGAKVFSLGGFAAPGVQTAQAVLGRPPVAAVLLWVYRGPIDSAAFLTTNTTAMMSPDSVSVVDLGASHPLATSYGIASERIVNPASGATFQASGGCSWIEFNWVAGSAEVAEIVFRRSDANNAFILRMSQASSTISLIKLEAGVEASQSSLASTFSIGTQYRITLLIRSATMDWFVDNTRITNTAGFGAGTFNENYSNCLVQGFASATELTVWPLDATKFWPQGV